MDLAGLSEGELLLELELELEELELEELEGTAGGVLTSSSLAGAAPSTGGDNKIESGALS